MEKPPIGLKPKEIHDQDRAWEIMAAMERYKKAGKTIPVEWQEEYVFLTKPCDNCPEWENLKHTTDSYLIHCPTCGRILQETK